MRYLLLLSLIICTISSFSQTKRYYVTPQSAKLITKKISEYDKVYTELSLVKRELVKTKKELKIQDSLNSRYIDLLDSMYVSKLETDKKKYTTEVKNIEPIIIENKKIKKQNRFLKTMIIGITSVLTVLYVTK